MKRIQSTWLEDKHKLKMNGTYSGEDLRSPGQAICLLHCTTCDEWWPISGWFNSHPLSLYELKIQATDLHRQFTLNRAEQPS